MATGARHELLSIGGAAVHAASHQWPATRCAVLPRGPRRTTAARAPP